MPHTFWQIFKRSLILACLLILIGLPLFLFGYIEWGNQQRVGQIIIYTAACVFLANSSEIVLVSSFRVFFSWLFVWVGFALLSAGYSAYPGAALYEVALFLASGGFFLVIFNLCGKFRTQSEKIIGLVVRIVCLGLLTNFYIGYVAAWSNPDLVFHPHNLITGFSNIRFQGQFLTLVVPVLLFPLLAPAHRYSKQLLWLDQFVAVSCIAMVVMAGTRGSVVAWLFACVVGTWLGGHSRALALRFFWLAVVGFCWAWLMQNTLLWVNPSSGLALFRMASEHAFGLSGREMIWSLAWQQFLLHPWLGIGPMHFAALGSPVAAHPHQVILQLLSEWGLPATLLMLGIVLRWFIQAGKKLKSNTLPQTSLVGVHLFFALTASMMQAMVDGVLVMPYTQLWLFLLAGWAVAVFSDPLPVAPKPSVALQQKTIKIVFGVIYAASVVVLISAVYVAWPHLQGDEHMQSACNMPRFWVSGCLPLFP